MLDQPPSLIGAALKLALLLPLLLHRLLQVLQAAVQVAAPQPAQAAVRLLHHLLQPIAVCLLLQLHMTSALATTAAFGSLPRRKPMNMATAFGGTLTGNGYRCLGLAILQGSVWTNMVNPGWSHSQVWSIIILEGNGFLSQGSLLMLDVAPMLLSSS
jgi:hypothetical protein